jgi:glutathione reductase (NADPH)
MGKRYDLAIIGTGVAAGTAAAIVRNAGWSVAVIDHHPFGGTCALRGCDPKKVLISAARALDATRSLHGKGVAGDARIDWAELMRFKRSFTDPVPAAREQEFAAQGMDALHGQARFVGPNRLEIGDQQIEAGHVLLAAGAEPVRLNIPGASHAITSEQFMELDRLPARVVMLGGGYIAAEFSHLAARAGATVTVLEQAERMLTPFDPDLVEWLMQRFRELGIAVRTGTTVTGIDKTPAGFRISTRSARGEPAVEADLVVHAAGRAPELDSLGLDAAGVARDGRGRLKLNAFLQSESNPAVYAAGDAAQSGPPLTPVAGHESEVVAANLLHGNARRPDYRGVASVAFTIPPIAAVGLSERQARERGLSFRANAAFVPHWAGARRVGATVYGYKVLVETGTDRILGAHLVGPEVDETINLFALAIRHDLTAADLKAMLFSYPTAVSDLKYML